MCDDNDGEKKRWTHLALFLSVAVMAQLPLAVRTATPRIPRGTSRSLERADRVQRAVGDVVPVRLMRCLTNTQQNTAAWGEGEEGATGFNDVILINYILFKCHLCAILFWLWIMDTELVI